MSSEEIAAAVEEIRERVRSRYRKQVQGLPDLSLPSLSPMLQSRDSAAGKVAAIGTVNPRPPGLGNSLAQAVKRLVSRALAWHVREQVEFNRSVIDFMDRTLAVLEEHNRDFVKLGELGQQACDAASNVRDWRAGWEEKWAKSEIHMLRSVSELNGAFQHRVSLLETNFREQVKAQHADYLGALDRTTLDIQKRLWDDLAKLRQEHEKQMQIRTELRLIRQRAAAWVPGALPASPSVSGLEEQAQHAAAAPPAIQRLDYARFAERFRGEEAYVAEAQKFYLPFFQGRQRVLDLGSGRGEFLELMRRHGVGARGVDSDSESIAVCREKGLNVDQGDLFAYLSALPGSSLDGVFSSQVVEHLPPARLPELVALISEKLEPGGVVAIETPNPDCLAIFATNFYLDPTHVRPVPSALLHFYLEECGVQAIEVHQRAPAAEQFAEIAALGAAPGLAGFQRRFFGGLDYAIIGRKAS